MKKFYKYILSGIIFLLAGCSTGSVTMINGSTIYNSGACEVEVF